MVNRTAHGGGCCGIVHLSDFGIRPFSTILKALDSLIEIRKTHRRSGLIEIVLTDLQTVEWEEALTQRGFVRVTRFLNSNSGNYCNVYHLKTGQNPFKDASDYFPMDVVESHTWRIAREIFWLTVATLSILCIYGTTLLLQRIL